MDKEIEEKMQAAAFRGLVKHLQQRTDVQNIDLMNLAGFCRNCLAKWCVQSAKDLGEELSYEEACEMIYGMPVKEWKEKYQTPASEEQMKQFEATKPLHAKISGHN